MAETNMKVSMTEEEYIQYELTSDVRHEYVNGQLIAMPGELLLNNFIAGNLFLILKYVLKGKGIHVFTHDSRLQIPNESIYFYPDLFVSTEKITETKYIATTAILVAEVLSKTTKSNDAIDKFIEYRKIPELQYYLLIEPVKKIVQLFTKDESGQWQMEYYTDEKEIIQLPQLQVSFTIADLYE